MSKHFVVSKVTAAAGHGNFRLDGDTLIFPNGGLDINAVRQLEAEGLSLSPFVMNGTPGQVFRVSHMVQKSTRRDETPPCYRPMFSRH